MRQSVGAFPATFVEGVVVSPQDGDNPIYARVRLPSYHTNVPDDLLPLYRILFSCDVTGHNKDGLAKRYTTLAPGTRVEVLIKDAEAMTGSVFGVYANESNDARAEGLKHGWEDDIGNSVEFFDDGRIVVKDKGGLTIEHDGAGSITFTGLDVTFNLQNMTINASDTALIKAEHFKVVSGDLSMTDTGTLPEAPTLSPRSLPAPPDTTNLKDEW